MWVVGSKQTIFYASQVCQGNGSRCKSVRKVLKLCGICPCRGGPAKASHNQHRLVSTSSPLFATPPSFLSSQEVSTILRTNEGTREFTDENSPIRSFDFNQLAANNPIEDTKNEALYLPKNGHLFGVFDGHAGSACAQVLAKRLFHYVAANLATGNDPPPPSAQLLQAYSDGFEFVDVLRDLYSRSHEQYRRQVAQTEGPRNPAQALTDACLALDADISREALQTSENRRLALKTLSVAMSGAVAVVAYVEGANLHVASVGDCQAVLGVLNHDMWQPKVLSVQHNAENADEVQRIISEHPSNEKDNIIKYDRLFGQLAPLRAFGDVRYKWDGPTLRRVAVPHFGEGVVAPGYLTPPYLTAQPHVMSHSLAPNHKFLILATDGLWDFITPHQAVRLVGEHMRGRTVLTPFSLPSPHLTLGQINEALLTRKECLTMRPADCNASTHLIRSALSATEYGIDHARLAQLLALPRDVARNFRDDMTVTVVYFDEEFLRREMITSNNSHS